MPYDTRSTRDLPTLLGRARALQLRELLDRLLDDKGRLPVYFRERGPVDGFEIAHRVGSDGLELLRSAGLVQIASGTIYESRFRVHALDASVGRPVYVVTDFPEDISDRVFPWTDEGVLLARKVLERTDRPPRTVLNSCSGGGTVALLLAAAWPGAFIVGVDTNPRAVGCASFSAELNDFRRLSFARGDLYPSAEEDPAIDAGPYDLVVADPPFALQPPTWEEHPHSAGGPLGERVVEALLSSVSPHIAPGGRLVMLAYSLGKGKVQLEPVPAAGERPVRIQDLVIRYLDPAPPAGTLVLLEGEPVWRFLERKSIHYNPMPVRYLLIRCGDPTYRMHERTDGVESYIRWIEDDLVGSDYTYLYYLVIDYGPVGVSHV